jgi:hypothetical protein
VVLLRRSALNLQRQRGRLTQTFLINLANFLFLGIFFLGLRVPVRPSLSLSCSHKHMDTSDRGGTDAGLCAPPAVQ